MKIYQLLWKGEVIEDEITSRTEAEELQREYNMAYGGGVRIK